MDAYRIVLCATAHSNRPLGPMRMVMDLLEVMDRFGGIQIHLGMGTGLGLGLASRNHPVSCTLVSVYPHHERRYRSEAHID